MPLSSFGMGQLQIFVTRQEMHKKMGKGKRERSKAHTSEKQCTWKTCKVCPAVLSGGEGIGERDWGVPNKVKRGIPSE